jgi:Phage terminase-like protein, large subunit
LPVFATFTGCVLTFRHDGKYISIKHSFARKAFVDQYYGYSRMDEKFKKIAPPIAKWEEQGLLTVVDEPTIDPQLIVDWFTEQSKLYNIKEVVIDNFRADLLRRFFEEAGFEVEVIRNPTAISALLAPRVEDGFANHKFIWGDDPLMRWYTNNVYVTIDKKGNKNFSKKDEKRRKTDGFMAFVYSLYRADDLDDYDIGSALDTIAGLNF